MKCVRSVSFGVVCGCGACLTILVFRTLAVRVNVFASGFANVLASVPTLLLVAGNSSREALEVVSLDVV